MAKAMEINLDHETHQQLCFIGKSASLTENQLAEEAVRAYAREKESYIKAVQKGQDDISNGEITSHKDLIAELETRSRQIRHFVKPRYTQKTKNRRDLSDTTIKSAQKTKNRWRKI